MALNLEAKKAVVEQVNAVAMSAVSVGAAEYRGLNVEQMTNLRNSAMEADVSLRVVKNTLAKRALAETSCACITPVLSGPVILGFSQEDPGAVARVFRDFIKENKDLVVLVPPEGTRSKVARWKTGFYHIANIAEVPILMGYVNAEKKEAGFADFFYPTGDVEGDLEKIREFYHPIKGLIADNS